MNKKLRKFSVNLVLVALFSFFIVFSQNSYSQDNTAISDLQQQIEFLKSQIKTLETTVNNINNKEQKLEQTITIIDTKQKNINNIQKPKSDKPLNVYAPGLKSLKIGGSTRVRFEDNSNFDFDDDKGDGKEFTLLRTRLNFDAEVNDHVRGFVEIQDNRLFGEQADAPNNSEFAAGAPLTLAGAGGGTIGNLNRVDVLQSFIDVSLFETENSDYNSSNLSLRIGRWQMNYGGQKVISPLDWLNQGRAWDGIRMRYEQKKWSMPFWVDVFATQLDEDFVDGGRGGEDEDKIFTGVYGHLDWQKGHSVEPYMFYRRSKGGPEVDPVDGSIRPFPKPDGVQGATGRTNEERTTIGIRTTGKIASIPGLKYTGEAVSQFGTINGDGMQNLSIENAFGFYTEVSYTKENWKWKPQIGYAFSYASGDDDPNDDKSETFDQIYPLAHAYLGYIDFQAWQNVVSHKFSLSAKPLKGMLAKVDFHFFDAENENDAWYGVGGGPNGGFGAGVIDSIDADREIGQELDFTLKYNFHRLNTTFGYSHFFAGDLIEDVKGDDDGADWFYLMSSIKF